MAKSFPGTAAVLAAFLAAAPACKKHQETHVIESVEEAPRLASIVQMSDGTMAGQLVSGFYGVEGGSWRWTAQKFAVNLRPPAGAAARGAALELHLTVPPPTIQKLGGITLAASIGGTALDPETYTKAGLYTYRRDVPPTLLSGDVVRIDFQLDKVLAPGGADQRELGLIASSVALVAK